MSQFKRELKRENKVADHSSETGDLPMEFKKGGIQQTCMKRNVIKPPMGVKPLPPIGEDLEGQLNNDTRSHFNDPEKAAKVPLYQKRNVENRKFPETPESELNDTDTYGRKGHVQNTRSENVD